MRRSLVTVLVFVVGLGIGYFARSAPAPCRAFLTQV